MLILGIRGRHTEIVTMEKAASSLGSGGLDVYGTPAMIALMEGTAYTVFNHILDPELTTVGTLVNIQDKAGNTTRDPLLLVKAN
jgi:predicted thioesterase